MVAAVNHRPRGYWRGQSAQRATSRRGSESTPRGYPETQRVPKRPRGLAVVSAQTVALAAKMVRVHAPEGTGLAAQSVRGGRASIDWSRAHDLAQSAVKGQSPDRAEGQSPERRVVVGESFWVPSLDEDVQCVKPVWIPGLAEAPPGFMYVVVPAGAVAGAGAGVVAGAGAGAGGGVSVEMRAGKGRHSRRISYKPRAVAAYAAKRVSVCGWSVAASLSRGSAATASGRGCHCEMCIRKGRHSRGFS